MKTVGESGTSSVSVLMMIIAGVPQKQANPGEGGGNEARALTQCLLVDEDQTTIRPSSKTSQQVDQMGLFRFCPGSEGGRLRREVVKGDGEKRRHASLTRS
jgi:hypothetical protein